MPNTKESEHLAAVGDRLATAMPDVPRKQIEQTIAEEYARFDGRTVTVRDFVPLLVERKAREALRTVAH